MQCLQKVEDGEITRLLGLLPPGSGKSLFTSVVFPTHFLGRFPKTSIIVASYGSDLPRKFGRKARSIVRQPIYKRIFGTELSPDSQAVDEWSLTNGSDWLAQGILSGITGNRADGTIWDDLIKGREQADSKVVRDKTWDAYMDDLMTRKKPRAFEIGITCMTGDTQVVMGNGVRRALRDIRIGDEVLSFKNEEVIKRKVLNWAPQGVDDVFEVRTGSSKVRANARHPFLVARRILGANTGNKYCCTDFENLEWVRVSDLKVGDILITQSKSPENDNEYAELSKDQAWLLGYMFGDGWITVRNTTQKGYKGHTYPRRGYVTCVALSNDGHENEKVAYLFEKIFGIRPKATKYQQRVTEIARIGRWFLDMGLKGRAKTKRLPDYLFSESEDVRLAFLDGFANADGHHTPKNRVSLCSCNIELMNDLKVLARGVGYKVTNIYSKQQWMQAPSSPKPTFSTTTNLQYNLDRVDSDFFGRAIISIKPVGREEVFDIQVEETENFIADGLVSHNTRWHEDDPAGRILPVNYDGKTGWVEGLDGNLWYVVCLPAICEREDDPLGRKVGDRLWPEWFTEKHFEPYKRNARTWSALFQQRPAPESGDYFQSEWLKPYGEGTRVPAPHRDTLHVYGASDYATTDDGGNYTVHIVAGIDPNHNVFLLDLWRARTSSDKWVETFCDLVQKWRPLGWAEETGQIRAGVGPFLHKRLMERQLFIARARFPTRGDKQVRAQSIRGRAAMGCLYVPTAASWYPDFRSELLAFPAGKTDDQVDCLGLIGQILDKMVQGSPKSIDASKQKILSTDPNVCTVTLDDVWEENEKNNPKGKRLRIV